MDIKDFEFVEYLGVHVGRRMMPIRRGGLNRNRV